MLSRRAFHGRLLALVASGAFLPSALRAGTGAAATVTGDDVWLNRLTYGATPQARADIAGAGRAAWLEAQLALPPDDPATDARLAAARLRIQYPEGQDENGHSWQALDEMRPLATLGSDPETRTRLVDWSIGMEYSERARPAQEVIAATLIRAVHAPAQLREVMTGFWHDHFSVNAQKNEFTAAFFPDFDRTLRQHALGNFRDMLGAVARAPSMLYYLNNDESRASPANENYARELLELHTLGAPAYLNDRVSHWSDVPGAADGRAEGYIDQDVYEVARAFTGWSVGDGRWISEGVTAPATGRFHFVAAWHDPYQKRILGREFAPQRGPEADGDEVLDMLARHPATARYVTTKLARRLLSDEPPADLVAALQTVFLDAADAPDQIAQVVRALVTHPAFDATPPGKLRRPFEFLTALLRASGAEVTVPENAHAWQLSRAGWNMHSYGPPTGHPDVMSAWTGASALNRYVDLALYAHDDWFGVARADLSSVVAGETLTGFVTRHVETLAPGQGEAVLDALAEPFGIDRAAWDAGQATDASPEDRAGLAISARAFAALSPAVMLR
jgi:uncharacterized protein (DUF1800 family)